MTQNFEDGSHRLYVFSAMTRQARVEELSMKERRLLQAALEEERQTHSVRDVVGDSLLDLTKAEDIQTWWKLRKILQVDLVDESASMDFLVTMTSVHISIMTAALIDWLVHDSKVHPGLVLTLLLIASGFGSVRSSEQAAGT